MKTYWRTAAYGALLLVLLATAGCDSNDAEDDSDFAVFAQGTWRLTEFVIDDSDLSERVFGAGGEYTAVFFTFSEDDDTSIRRFEIRAQARDGGEGSSRQASGQVSIDGEDDELIFTPAGGSDISDPFILDYIIESTGRARLFARDNTVDGLVFRQLLLPNSQIGGEFPEIQMTIERSLGQTN